MADQLLDQIRDVAEGQILFVSQAITFVVGYILQDIKLAVYIALGGTALTFVAIIPPWPFFNKNPVKWLPVGRGAASSQNISIPQTVVIDEKAIR
ncbi:hypothetical protein Sste5344_009117 [Sporothrix stenoceras]